MLQRGVPFLGPPADQPGGRFAVLVDPDGNQLGLHQAGSH
jgi:predicted enzyme related to lactoylglutathione lyase